MLTISPINFCNTTNKNKNPNFSGTLITDLNLSELSPELIDGFAMFRRMVQKQTAQELDVVAEISDKKAFNPNSLPIRLSCNAPGRSAVDRVFVCELNKDEKFSEVIAEKLRAALRKIAPDSFIRQ